MTQAILLGILLAAADPYGFARGGHHKGERRDARWQRDSRVSGWSLDPSSNSSFLLYQRYTPSASVAAGTLTTTSGTITSVVRATTRLCKNAAGLYVSLSNNQACSTSFGVDVSFALTNSILRSDALDNASWTKASGVTVTADQGAYLASGSTLDKIDTTGAGDFVSGVSQTSASFSAATGPHAVSAFFQSTSGSAPAWVSVTCPSTTASTCGCGRDDNLTCTATNQGSGVCVAQGTVTTSLTRMWAYATCASSVTTIKATLGAGTYGTSTGAVITGGVNNTRGAAMPGPPTVTAASAVATNADVITAVNPLTISDTNFCFRARIERPAFPGNGAGRYMAMSGTNASANSIAFYLAPSGSPRCELRDGSNGVLLRTGFDAAQNGSVAECCFSAGTGGDGTIRFYVNGQQRALVSTTSTGTGLLGSMPAAFWIGGASASAGFAMVQTGLADLRICPGKRCK